MTASFWTTLLIVLFNLILFPFFLYLMLVAWAAIGSKRSVAQGGEPRSRFLIVIPAHNEEAGIAATVRGCFAQGYPRSLFDVMVIADNCQDQTALAAAEAGADVLERFDEERKSKGYAIEYLLETLAPSGLLEDRHALVIIDADTLPGSGMLAAFDRRLRQGQDWIQCYYTVLDPDRSWRTRLMTYAFSLFNGVQPLGLYVLGSSAGFRGNGMCFSTRGLRRNPWRSYGLVEDMEYSWTLRVAGERIAFERSVEVAAAMPTAGGKAAATQRARWEFGRSHIRRRFLPQIWRSRRLSVWDKILSLLELLLPTMAALAVLYLLAVVLNVGVIAVGGLNGPVVWMLLVSTALMTLGLGSYALAPFLVFRLPWRYFNVLVFFPGYIFWKIAVAWSGPPRAWVRTEREPAPGDADRKSYQSPT